MGALIQLFCEKKSFYEKVWDSLNSILFYPHLNKFYLLAVEEC